MKKDPRYDWRTVFLANSGGLSSKRIISIFGMLTCIVIFIVAFITGKDVPEFGDAILIACISLYGVDKIPNFRSRNEQDI